MEVDLSGGSSSGGTERGGGGGSRDRHSANRRQLDEPSPLDEPSLNSPPPSPGKKRKMASAAAASSTQRRYGATSSSYSRPSPPTQNRMGSLPPAPRSRPTRYDSSDSDSDAEYLALALQGDEERRKKREAEEAAAAAAAAAEVEARRKSKKKRAASSDSSSSSSDDDDEAAVGGKKKVASPVMTKKKDRCADSSSDSDGDLDAHLSQTRRDEEARRPRNPFALQRAEEAKFASIARAKSAKTQDHRRRKKKDGSGSDSDDDDSVADTGGTTKAAAAKAEDDDDGFFSDAEQFERDGGNNESSSGDDQKKRKKRRAKSSPRGVKRGASSASSGSRAKSAGPRSKSSSSSAGAKKKPPAKKKNDTEDEDEKVCYDVDMEELSDEDEDLENRLKPAFAKPKFAVGALEPLEMTVTNTGKAQTATKCMIESDIEVTRHYVPASINRYLQPYQMEGIQFMHKIITDQKTPRGCILGDGEQSLAFFIDPVLYAYAYVLGTHRLPCCPSFLCLLLTDMGLGKTVQIIGLLAAIQKKGGNDLDLKLLKQKCRRIAQELAGMQKREEDALLQGLPIPPSNKEEMFEDAKKSGRILVIVPASVITNWQNEFKAWGHFGVAVYEGQDRRDALERVRDGRDEILVVGKPLFTKVKTDFPHINQLDWRLVICDEMHEYKGHKTNGHKCLEELRNKSMCPVIGLTGTLVQNNCACLRFSLLFAGGCTDTLFVAIILFLLALFLFTSFSPDEELHTLVTLVQPGLIGDRKTFMDQTGKPLMNMR